MDLTDFFSGKRKLLSPVLVHGFKYVIPLKNRRDSTYFKRFLCAYNTVIFLLVYLFIKEVNNIYEKIIKCKKNDYTEGFPLVTKMLTEINVLIFELLTF